MTSDEDVGSANIVSLADGAKGFPAMFYSLGDSIIPLGELHEVRNIVSKYNGELEVRLWDGSRVDILTETHAIEADWSHKWTEAVGQSMYYSLQTGKKPGIMLLVRDFKAEERFIYRCQLVCKHLGIDLFLEHILKGS